MNTVSAPSGIGAPVKIRTAWPGLRCLPGCARLHAAAHRKRLLLLMRQVAAMHGIAVDGGIGERRQRQGRGDIARENAPIGLGQRDAFRSPHRRHAARR